MNYTTLARQISAIKGASVIGNVHKEQYPFYMIKRGKGQKVLLLGGVHGDEPAGIYAIMDFFRNHSKRYEQDFEFTAFACVNPQGYNFFIRGTNPTATELQGTVNLNREYKQEPTEPEMKLLIPRLEKYLFAMDFHETWPSATRAGKNEPNGKDPTEFYLWEYCEDKTQRAGLKILDAIKKEGFPVCQWDIIYDDKNNRGVIWYPEDCATECYAQGNTSDSFLVQNGHTPQAFTIETPRGLDLEKRVHAHVTTLKTVLDAKMNNPSSQQT